MQRERPPWLQLILFVITVPALLVENKYDTSGGADARSLRLVYRNIVRTVLPYSNGTNTVP